MTLKEIILEINSKANSNPNVNTIVDSGNIFDLNTDNNQVKYSAFCAEQLNHQVILDNFLQYSFRLYYADRIREDKSNIEEVQSTSIRVLNNIVFGLQNTPNIQVNSTRNITIFEQRFEALCAGAYMDIQIICPIDYICEEQYSVGPVHLDFNSDFNFDFA